MVLGFVLSLTSVWLLGGFGLVAPERDQLIWTESTGLSAVGEVALRWLRDARHHGLEDLQASVNSIDERLSLLTRDGGHATPSAVAELLSDMLKQPFFDELRTKQQLGYSVGLLLVGALVRAAATARVRRAKATARGEHHLKDVPSMIGMAVGWAGGASSGLLRFAAAFVVTVRGGATR